VDANGTPCEPPTVPPSRPVRPGPGSALPWLLLGSWLSLGSWLAASPARAADAVVLSVGGDAPAEAAMDARRAAAEVLGGDGVDVLPEADLAVRIAPARLRALSSLDEARALAFELEARLLVAVAVWRGAEGTAAGEVTVSLVAGARNFTATVAVGSEGTGAAAAEAVRAARRQQTEALVLLGPSAPDTRVRPAAEQSASGPDEDVAPGPAAPPRAPQGQDVVAPTMLGACGLAGVGLGAYALLGEVCEVRGPSGTCLRGDGPNAPAGVTLAVAGGLSVVGAVVWLVTGAAALPTQPRIDVVLGPSGGSLGARGMF